MVLNDAYSEVDENSLGKRSYTGKVNVICEDETTYVGTGCNMQKKEVVKL